MPKTGLAVIVMVNAPEVAGSIADELLGLLNPAVATAPGVCSEPSDFSEFCGLYCAQPWGAESAVVQWIDQLALLPLNATAGLSTENLLHIEGDTFRIVRQHDEGLGEEVTFRRNSSGRVVSKVRHGQVNLKTSDACRRPIVPVLSNPTYQKTDDDEGRTTTTIRPANSFAVITIHTGCSSSKARL